MEQQNFCTNCGSKVVPVETRVSYFDEEDGSEIYETKFVCYRLREQNIIVRALNIRCYDEWVILPKSHKK